MENSGPNQGAQRGGHGNRGRGRGNGQSRFFGRGGFQQQQPTFHPGYGGSFDGRGRGRFNSSRFGGRSFGGRHRGGFAGRSSRGARGGDADAQLGQNLVGRTGGMGTLSADQAAQAAALLQQAFVTMQGGTSSQKQSENAMATECNQILGKVDQATSLSKDS